MIGLGTIWAALGLDITGLKTGGAQANKIMGELDRNLQSVEQSYKQIGSTIQSFGQKLSSVGMKMTIGLTAPLVALASKMTLTAARTEVLGVAMEAVAKATGTSMEELKKQEAILKKQGITTQEARGILTLFMQSQLDVADASKVARVAQDLAVISGQNSSEAARTLTDAITSQEPMLLRNYGIVKNLDEIYETYGKEIGLVTEKTDKNGKVQKIWQRELTETEKKQSFLNIITKEGEKVAGTYETAMGKVGKKLTSLPRYFEEAANSLGEQFLPTFNRGVDVLTDWLKAITEMTPAQKKFTIYALGMVAAIGPLFYLIGQLIESFGGLYMAIGNVVGIIGSVVGAFTSLSGVMTGAGTILSVFLGGLLAIGAAFVGFYVLLDVIENWKTWKGLLEDTVKSLKPLFDKLKEIQDLWNTEWKDLPISEKVTNALQAASDALRQWWEGELPNQAKAGQELAGELLFNLGEALGSGLGKALLALIPTPSESKKIGDAAGKSLGEKFVDGFLKGIEENWYKIEIRLAALVSGILPSWLGGKEYSAKEIKAIEDYYAKHRKELKGEPITLGAGTAGSIDQLLAMAQAEKHLQEIRKAGGVEYLNLTNLEKDATANRKAYVDDFVNNWVIKGVIPPQVAEQMKTLISQYLESPIPDTQIQSYINTLLDNAGVAPGEADTISKNVVENLKKDATPSATNVNTTYSTELGKSPGPMVAHKVGEDVKTGLGFDASTQGAQVGNSWGSRLSETLRGWVNSVIDWINSTFHTKIGKVVSQKEYYGPGLPEGIYPIGDAVGDGVGDSVLDSVSKMIKWPAAPEASGMMGDIIASIIKMIKEAIPKWLEEQFKVLGAGISGIGGLLPEMIAKWNLLSSMIYAASGIMPKIISGYRSIALQASMYAAYILGGKKGAPVATPQGSRHPKGAAIDVGPPSIYKWVARFASMVGLNLPMPKVEPWHLQLPGYAEGGLITKPTVALIGEKGPEWVIPTNVSQWLSKVGLPVNSESSKSYQFNFDKLVLPDVTNAKEFVTELQEITNRGSLLRQVGYSG